MSKIISVRAEGGIGDCLLATRFVPAIKELYPDSEIVAYLDTEGNNIQKEVIDYLYPSIYKKTIVIPNKKYKKFVITSQFGEENGMIGYLDNVPPSTFKEMTDGAYDFFDLHIDSLKFLDLPFDWAKYFYTFPKPEINVENYLGKYIISHLISSTSKEHRLDTSFYLTRLILEIDSMCEKLGYRHIIISTPEFNKYYEESQKLTKCSHVICSEIKDVCDLIINAKLMISVDSGFRPIAYPLMPVISFSKQCQSPNQVPVSHRIRWNPFLPIFPLNWNIKDIIQTAKNLLSRDGLFKIFPEIASYKETDLDNILIKRKYSVDEQKSILNDSH